MTRNRTRIQRLLALAAALAIGGALAPTAAAASNDASSIAALPGYRVSRFVDGTGVGTNPDAIAADGSSIYVAYQNDSAKDGSTAKPSTIVQYAADGTIVKTFHVVGHCDGLRIDPATHLLWATVNEDAKARLYTIDPATSAVAPYHFSAAPHGGGYDDLAFVNRMAFVAASNPTLTASGENNFPAIDSVVLKGTTAVVTPVLLGNASALDATTKAAGALKLIDPDSLTVDPMGDLVLIDQGGAQIISIGQPGTPKQAATRLPVGTQLDDAVWATAKAGRLFVVDAARNAVYIVRAAFAPNTLYAEAPNDSGVAGFVGTVDPTTGIATPIAIGFGKATGLLFVPDQAGGSGGSEPVGTLAATPSA